MKINNFRRPTREIADIPPATELFFNITSDQMEQLTSALQGRLSMKDNFHTEEVEYEAADGVESLIRLKTLRTKAKKVMIDWTGHNSPWRHSWRIVDADRIGITIKWDSAPSVATKIQATVFGE